MCGLSQHLHHKHTAAQRATDTQASLSISLCSPSFYLNVLPQNEQLGRQIEENEKETDKRSRDNGGHFVLFGSFFLPPCCLICFLSHLNNCPRLCYPLHSMFSHPPSLLSSHPHSSFPALAFRCGVYVKAAIIFRKMTGFCLCCLGEVYRKCLSHKIFHSVLCLYFRCGCVL